MAPKLADFCRLCNGGSAFRRGRRQVPRKQACLAFSRSERCSVAQSGGGLPMRRFVEDHQKRRLTEKGDILTAINILRTEGYTPEELIEEITRIFYVDLDAYNEAVNQAA
jgi:hypothetical protein